MGVIIDSSILIAWKRGHLDPNQLITGHEHEPFFLSVITVSELLHGVHRATDEPIRLRRSAFVENVLSNFPIIDIDPAVARVHAKLLAELSSEGRAIGINDSWIAATCLAYSYALATVNIREFSRVPMLAIIPSGYTTGA